MRRNENGEVVFHATNEQDQVVSALKEIVRDTEIGRTYKEDYYTSDRGDEDYQKLIKAAQLIAGGPKISTSNLVHALTLLLDSGEIQPKDFEPSPELTEPEEDTRPRDKNGNLLMPQQIAFKKHAEFANTHSVNECRIRAKSDRAFGDFMRKQLQSELNSTAVGDAVTPAGQSTSPRNNVSRELTEFARKYNAEPIANLKPKGGFVKLAGEQIRWSDFQATLAKAVEARLI